jgi:hypothetical protein
VQTAEFVSQAYWGVWNKFEVFLGETIFKDGLKLFDWAGLGFNNVVLVHIDIGTMPTTPAGPEPEQVFLIE